MSGHSVLSAMVASVIDAAREIGLDADALQRAAGIEPGWLADPDARVPVTCDLELWRLIARQPVGLELGARLGVSGLGVLGYAMQHSATVAEALAFTHRLRSLIHPEVMPRHELSGGEVVFWRVLTPAFAELREPVYAQAAAMVTMMSALTGRPVEARRLSLSLTRPPDAERLERFFRCPVTWAAPRFELAFEAALLDTKLARHDPRLFAYLARKAEALHAALPAEACFADRARREIGLLLIEGEPRLEQVARRLAVSARTLHRRLQEEGTRFATLVEEARRARALLLLQDQRLSASEVAFLLGYSEPGPFFRAFKRWTGATPQAWRTAQEAPVAARRSP